MVPHLLLLILWVLQRWILELLLTPPSKEEFSISAQWSEPEQKQQQDVYQQLM